MALIEQITKDNSQLEKSSSVGHNFYQFYPKKNVWLYCYIDNHSADLTIYGQDIKTQYYYGICSLNKEHIWELSSQALKLGTYVSKWLHSKCIFTTDYNETNRATIKSDNGLYKGREARDKFRQWFKVLNTLENRIQAARVLKPNEDVFNYDKNKNIIGVRIANTTLLNFYIVSQIEKQEAEFTQLKEWYIPTVGVLGHGKRRRKK